MKPITKRCLLIWLATLRKFAIFNIQILTSTPVEKTLHSLDRSSDEDDILNDSDDEEPSHSISSSRYSSSNDGSENPFERGHHILPLSIRSTTYLADDNDDEGTDHSTASIGEDDTPRVGIMPELVVMGPDEELGNGSFENVDEDAHEETEMADDDRGPDEPFKDADPIEEFGMWEMGQNRRRGD